MKTLISTLLVIPLLFSAANLQPTAPSLVITHVTVIDLNAPDPLHALKLDQTVVITGNQISALGKTGKIKLPQEARTFDAEGRYMIPGLWDMHVNLLSEDRPEAFFGLFIANGITGVRDMGGTFSFERINQIRNQLASGNRVGPRLGAVAGTILNGQDTRIRPGVAVQTPEEGKRTVKTFKAMGADFINVSELLSREVYLAIIEEAKQQKLPVAGDVPLPLSAEEASDLGQQSIESLSDVLVSLAREEEELRQALGKQPDSTNAAESLRLKAEIRAVGSYNEAKAKSLYSRFFRNGTWQCPTLVVRRISSLADNTQLITDNRLRYIPTSTRNEWNDMFKRLVGAANVEDRRRTFQKAMEIVGAMQKSGVGILAGSDTPTTTYVYPGFSVHEELALLVQAGLTPMQALRTATVNPAKFLGLLNSLGGIEKGNLADLVILDANPLDDIRNTTRIHAVIANGRLFQRDTLQKLLSDAEASARK